VRPLILFSHVVERYLPDVSHVHGAIISEVKVHLAVTRPGAVAFGIECADLGEVRERLLTMGDRAFPHQTYASSTSHSPRR
jgi:hypothetical protein